MEPVESYSSRRGSGHRAERVAENIKAALSRILMRDIKSADLGFVTVTAVKMSRDLRMAKVYVTCLGSDDVREKSFACLKRSNSFVRRSLGQRVQLKYVPEIRFYIDTSAEDAQRIETLLTDLHGKSE